MQFQIQDSVEQSFQSIKRTMAQETSKLKSTFERMVGQLDEATKTLNSNFEDKKEQLKTMCATFFAKISDQVDKNTAISKKVDRGQELL